MKFAKVFDLEDMEQVLVTMTYDSDDHEYKINITTDFEEAQATASIGFGDNQEEQKAAFEQYGIENAREFREKMSVYFIKS